MFRSRWFRWWNSLSQPLRRRCRPAAPARPRLALPKVEGLEDRTVPTLLFSSFTGNLVQDHGGLVITHPGVELVFWGTGWNTGSGPALRTSTISAMQTLVPGPFLNGLSEYRGVGSGTLSSQSETITDPNQPCPPSVTNTDVNNMLRAEFANGNIPFSTDPSHVYLVVPQPGTTSTAGLGAHGGGTFNGFPYHYGWTVNVPALNNALDTITDTLSHDLGEICTDPNGDAFFDSATGHEIGDGEGKNYNYRLNGVLVQSLDSDANHAFIVDDGNLQTVTVSANGLLTVNGDQLTNHNDTITLKDNPSNEVIVNLNSEQFAFENVDPFSKLRLVTSVTVNTGTGNDTVNVDGTLANTPVTINLGTNTVISTDTVNITPSDRNLNDLHGNVTVNTGNAATASLNVDDQANTASGQTYTLTASSVIRTGSALISYHLINFIGINGGIGNDTYNVTGTESGVFNPLTTLHTGTGTDTVNIRATTGDFTVNGDGARPTVNISSQAPSLNGTLAAISGSVTITNSSGALNLGDAADPGGCTTTISSSSLSGGCLGITGIINYNDNSQSPLLSSLTLDSSNAGNSYEILGTPPLPGGTTLQTGNGTSTVNVRATTGPLTVNLGGGTDTVNVSSFAHNLDTIQGHVTANGGTGFDVLNIDDQAKPVGGQTYTVTPTSISRTGSALVSYGGDLFDSIVLQADNTSDLQNKFIVTGTESFYHTDLIIGSNAAVDIQATTGPLSVTAPGSANDTSVVVGSLGSVQALHGSVFLDNPQSVEVNDSADPTARTVTMSALNGVQTISGLAPVPISYNELSLGFVTVDGGTGGNTFNVAALINRISGNTTFTTIGNSGGHNTVNVGDAANTLNEIAPLLILNGRTGDTLNLNDQGSSTPHMYNFFIDSNNPPKTTFTRSPGGPTIEYSSFPTVHFHPGVIGPNGPEPGNVIEIDGTDPNSTLEVGAGAGDVVNVGNSTDGLDELQGPVTIDGGTVNVNDQMTASPQDYDLTQGGLARTGAAPLTYGKVQQEVLNGGGLGNTFDVDGVSAGTPVTIDTGTGFGNLVRMRRHELIQDALTLNGQGPSDMVGYVAYTTDVYINLLTGVATDLASFTGFHDVTGGQGNNIIVADDSEDTINGNLSNGSAGQDLIITGGSTGGGMGTVYGSGNGDILIGGSVGYATDPEPQAMTELQAILAEWTRTDLSYADRVAHIINGDDPLDPYPLSVAAGTVSDNGDQYNLIGHPNGGQGLNLYYVTNGDTDDANAMETVINLSGTVTGGTFHNPTAGAASLTQTPSANASSGQLANPAAPTAGVFLGGQRSTSRHQPASVTWSSGISADLPAVTDNGDLNVTR